MGGRIGCISDEQWNGFSKDDIGVPTEASPCECGFAGGPLLLCCGTAAEPKKKFTRSILDLQTFNNKKLTCGIL